MYTCVYTKNTTNALPNRGHPAPLFSPDLAYIYTHMYSIYIYTHMYPGISYVHTKKIFFFDSLRVDTYGSTCNRSKKRLAVFSHSLTYVYTYTYIHIDMYSHICKYV